MSCTRGEIFSWSPNSRGILFGDGECRGVGPEVVLKEKQAAALSGNCGIFRRQSQFALCRMNVSDAQEIAQRALQQRAMSTLAHQVLLHR
jgi:hypothetical protein